MMPTKPTVKPKWAENDVIDGTSGQNNVVEPSESKKLRGWDFEELPSRGWWNWLQRITYRWIDWFDGTTIPLTSTPSTTNEQKTDGTGHTHEITGFVTSDSFIGSEVGPCPIELIRKSKELYASTITGIPPAKIDDFAINSDGTKALIFIASSYQTFYLLNLATPFDITTATYSGVSYDTTSGSFTGNKFFVDRSGTRVYMSGTDGGSYPIRQFSMSSDFDLSSMADVNSQNVGATTLGPSGIYLSNDGSKMFLIQIGGPNQIHEYALSTDWDITTATYTDSLTKSEWGTNVRDISFNDNGSKLYVLTNFRMYQYSTIGGTIYFDLTAVGDYTSDIVFDDDDQYTVYFADDFKKIYIVKTVANSIAQYKSSVIMPE